MNRGIYFVGGASASGKSTCTARLAGEAGVGRIELDGFYNVIRHGVRNESALKAVAQDVVAFSLKKLVEADVGGILEGGWIEPAQAAELAALQPKRFCPVYCGYPNADVAARLEMILRHGKHWLTARDRPTALAWLEQQVDGSRWYQSECRAYGIPYFDFSDMDEGSRQLRGHYLAWRTGGPAAPRNQTLPF